jgi:hypothetical protein
MVSEGGGGRLDEMKVKIENRAFDGEVKSAVDGGSRVGLEEEWRRKGISPTMQDGRRQMDEDRIELKTGVEEGLR